jgi:Acetokinase family
MPVAAAHRTEPDGFSNRSPERGCAGQSHLRPFRSRTALHFVITWLEANLADMKVVAAGHRVVLGGTRFEAPARIDGDVLDYLDSLAVMEPSHQTYNVRGARALAEAFPGLPQVDSSFHRTMPEDGAAPNRAPRASADSPSRRQKRTWLSLERICRAPEVKAGSPSDVKRKAIM